MTATTSRSRAEEHVPTPIDVYLRRQSQLTAVERFAGHTPGPREGPATERWWQDRLPATPPGPGQQYGFRVDLDACTGCKACVSACHSLNGLSPDESWRSVGALRGGGASSTTLASVRTVTTACHHCVEPACLQGCPANAYEKDPVTGIVRHLDDSCIGCSYCTLTCPYEVPQFHADLGIVRKCDMCADRLAAGEAPACVQACPTGAITIDVVDVAALVTETRTAGAVLVPGAPTSELTVPSTRYVSASPLPADLVADDRSSVQPAHGHTPLAVMLVLTQVAVGAFTLDAVAVRDLSGPARSAAALVALGTALLALGASILHLGRPRLAWRALLGLSHSWLSREILAFSLFAGMATAWSTALAFDQAQPLQGALAAGAVGAGLAGVVCSVAIYAATGRWWWSWRLTALRFGATTGAGGALLVAAAVAWAGTDDPAADVARRVVPLVTSATVLGLVGAVVPLVALLRPHGTDADTVIRTRRLLGGALRPMVLGRLALAVLAIGGSWTAIANLGGSDLTPAGPGLVLTTATLLFVAGELFERRLFFLASVAPRMPGMAR